MEIEMETDIVKEFVGVLGTLLDEAKLDFEKDGVKTSCVDPVAMVEASLNMDAFHEYSVKEPTEVGMDLVKIREFLGVGKTDRVKIEHDEKKNRLIFRMGNITRSMGLLDIAGFSKPQMPSLTLPNTATVMTKYLREGVKASGQVADHIALVVRPEGLEMTASGDVDEAEMVLPKDLLEDLFAEQSVRSLFPLDFFDNMVRAAKSKVVKIHLGTDCPIEMEWNLETKVRETIEEKETVKRVGNGLFLLAPRIESE